MAPAAEHADLLVGPASFDDAGVVRRPDGTVGLYTVDFFPPVVDDPRDYGAIAAANSLSDVYACGGEAEVVLNLAGFPGDWEEGLIGEIMEGAVEVVREAGALWVGGHTVRSDEPLFGFAVFGSADEEHLLRQDGARPGDLLYLTKPLGAGSITTGIKTEASRPEDVAVAVAGMRALNRDAARAARRAGAHAATDVTGFGLLGHAANLATNSEATFVLRSEALPLYPGAADLARAGVLSGGSARGRAALEHVVEVEPTVPEWLAALCFDAETSGGLLVAVPPEGAAAFQEACEAGTVPVHELVGEVLAGPGRVRLT